MDNSLSRARRLVMVAAVTPAVVVAVLVLLQGSTLPSPPSVPTVPARFRQVKLSPEIAKLDKAQAQAALQLAADQLRSSGSSRSDALTFGWIAALLLLGLGAVGAHRLARGRPVPPRPRDPDLQHDREVLVEACMRVYDSVESPAARQELLRALAGAGVTAVEIPAHTRFDPGTHKAADVLSTDQPRLDGLVAETERPGFIDRGRRLRWPEVVVYRAERRSASSGQSEVV